MLFPLPDDRRFRCAFLGATLLGGPAERLDELNDFYRMVAGDGLEHVFLTGGALTDGGQDTAYLARHYPRVPGVRTWYPCRPTAQAMIKAGRDDWVYLPPDGLQLLGGGYGVEVPMTFVHDPDSTAFDAACRQPPANGAVDHLQFFAGAPRCEGEVEHIGSSWLLCAGAFSGPPGSLVPVGACYAEFAIDPAGRVRDERVLSTMRF